MLILPIAIATTAALIIKGIPALRCQPRVCELEGAYWAGPILLWQLVVESSLPVEPVGHHAKPRYDLP